MQTKIILRLTFVWAPLLVGLVLSERTIALSEQLGALAMSLLATCTVIAMQLWKRSADGISVSHALGWRYEVLLISVIAIPISLAGIFVIQGEPIGETGMRMIVMQIALLFWILGWVSTLVPRNRFLGFRTKITLSDDDIWHACNRRYGRLLMALAPLSLIGLFVERLGTLVALLPALLVAAAFLLGKP